MSWFSFQKGDDSPPRESVNPSRPNFFERTVAFVAPVAALSRARAKDALRYFGYDAANPGTKRGFSGGLHKNGSSETQRNQRDRINLMWDARDMSRNFGIIRGILLRVAQYVCGKITYQASTGEEPIDTAYENYWKQWCKKADAKGQHHFRKLIWLIFISMKRDGDCGIIIKDGPTIQPTYGTPGAIALSKEDGFQRLPEIRIATVESDRIGNPMQVGNISDNEVHGITLNEDGAPDFYQIYKRNKNNQYTKEADIPAESFIHLFDPMRADEYRGTTFLCTALAIARDLYETFSMERGAAKWAASFAGVIRSVNPSRTTGAGAGIEWDGVTPEGTKTSTVQQNKLLKLAPSEDVTPFPPSSRPSGAFMALVDALIREIAVGLNLPYGFIYNMAAFNGATARLETMQAQRTFEADQTLLVEKVLDRIKDAVISRGIANRDIPAHPNWQEGDWTFGAHITADVGYQTSADLQLLNAGLKTASDIIAEQGGNYEDTLDRAIKEALMLRDKASNAGIPIELINQRFPDATQMLSNMETAQNPPPPPKPDVNSIGDKAVKTILELLQEVAEGRMPREKAIAQLVNLYDMSPTAAEAITPKTGSNPPPEPSTDSTPKEPKK